MAAPIDAVSGTSPTPAAAPAAPRSLNIGADSFLKLLVAQLKAQNPLDPSKPSDFMQQLVSLDGAQKLGEISAMMKGTLSSSKLQDGASLIGKTVKYTGPDGFEASARVDHIRVLGGKVTFILNNPQRTTLNEDQILEVGA